jgi:threonine dehydratase
MDGAGSKVRNGMTLSEFRHIRARIQPYIRTTPIVPSELPNVFLKLENLQFTHSFKLRGAFAHVTALVEAQDPRTILTVSAGNHGQGVARAASAFKLPCIVIVPKSAPKTKVEAIAAYGVELRLEGANYDAAEEYTLRLVQDSGKYAFVSPYNDRAVILGQGTLGFEILEQMPEVGTIVVPIGGGGLAAGVASVVKQLRPSVRVIGVQTEASAAIYHSLRAGKMIMVPDAPSIADGIAGNIDLKAITFPIIQKYLDDVVLVSEAEIRSSLDQILYREKLVVEGSAAAAYAAFQYGKVPASGLAVAIMTGGNVDLVLKLSSLPL